MRQTCVEMSHERGDFMCLEDGYYRWWPHGLGAISAEELRMIANELDRLNTDWDNQLQEFFADPKNYPNQPHRLNCPILNGGYCNCHVEEK